MNKNINEYQRKWLTKFLTLVSVEKDISLELTSVIQNITRIIDASTYDNTIGSLDMKVIERAKQYYKFKKELVKIVKYYNEKV